MTQDRKMVRAALHTSIAGFALIMASQPALAQAAAGEEDANNKEIVVTAQKRTENLRDVPISITAIGAEELKERGIQNVQDIQFGTPNLVTYSTSDINPNIIIRGIGSGSRNIGFESTLGIYIDGVYQGRSSGFFSDLDDVERVEVLRGPQGTLFGKNTTAGAINITTSTPGNDFKGNISAGYGNFNAWRVSGGLSGALITDKVFAKISGFREKADGTVRNSAPAGFRRVNDEDRYGFRGMLRFTPSENFEFDLRGDLSNTTRAGFEDEVLSVVQNPFGIPDDSVVPGRRTININGRDQTQVAQRGVSGTARLTIGEHILSSITAYRTQGLTALNLDPDNTSFDYLRQDFRDNTNQFSQELQLASPSSGRLKYVVGLYYYNQKSSSDRQTFVGTDLANLLVGGLGIPASLLDRNDIRTIGSVKTEALAGYFNASFQVTDRLSLIGGARLTQETKRLNVDQNVPLFISLPGILVPGQPLYVETKGATDRLKRSDFSPTLGVQYKLGDRVNSYARWSKGFKSAGWNAELLRPTNNGVTDPDFFNASGIRFGSESVENYEIGIKGDALDRKLGFSFAGFLTNYKDIQFSRFVGGLAGYATDNSNARIKGFELELDAQPANGLTLAANVGFTDAKYQKNATGATCGDTCIAGSRLVAPRWTLGLGAGYEAKISENGTLNFRLDYSYRSDDGGFGLPSTLDPTVETRANTNTPGFGIFDGRIGYKTGGLEFAVWGKNLLNKNYAVDRLLENNNALLGVVHEGVTYGEPRTFGATASYKF
jgi:iron complex outermembrane recepter protein